MAAEPEQPLLVSPSPSLEPTSSPTDLPPIPGYVTLNEYEELKRENEALKNQLKIFVPLQMYEDIMIEHSQLKTAKRAKDVEMLRYKYRTERLQQHLEKVKKGENLSKKVKHDITREVLAPKMSEAELDCYLKDNKKSWKWNNKGIYFLHMFRVRLGFFCSTFSAKAVWIFDCEIAQSARGPTSSSYCVVLGSTFVLMVLNGAILF